MLHEAMRRDVELTSAEPFGEPKVPFVEWYGATWPHLVGYLTVQLRGNASEASDMAAEAMARACASWSSIDNPTAWVFAVARNVLRRSAARRAIEQRVLGLFHRDSDVVETATDDPDLMRAVAALPRRQRTAVLLRYAADLTQQQVAEIMNIAPGTAAALLHTARKRLRADLTLGP